MLRQGWWSFFPFASVLTVFLDIALVLGWASTYINTCIATTDPQTCTYIFHSIRFLYSSLYTPEIFKKTEGFFKGGTFSTAAAACREATILKRAFNIIVITSQTTSSIILPYLLTTPCFLLDNSNRFSTTRQKSSSNIQV